MSIENSGTSDSSNFKNAILFPVLFQSNARTIENSSSYTQSVTPLMISFFLPSLVTCVTFPEVRSLI